MSTEYQSVLLVGLPFSDVKNAEELVDNGTFELIQPYFDAPYNDCLVGVPVYYSGCFGYNTLPDDVFKDEAVEKFKRFAVTSLEPKLYLSVDSY